MKKIFTLFLAGMLAMGVSAQSASQDEQTGVTPKTTLDNVSVRPPVTCTYGTGKGVLLYDNGPLVNIPGAAGFADTSRLQSVTLSMSTLGAGVQFSGTTDNRIADDIVITDSTWVIDSIVFYVYQTGSTLASTITEVNLRVWDQSPDQLTANIVVGDDATNVMNNTYWSNIYRDSESATGIGLTNRPVMAATVVIPGMHLPPGTWWLDFQTKGSLTSGPWAPAITITGQNTTGNALQYTSTTTAWAALNDGGSLTPQGIPFKIYGSKANTQGMEDLKAPASVKVYPNPATEQVRIESNTLISMVEIYNQIGQMVMSTTPESGSTTLDISNLQQGIYSVRVQSAQGYHCQKLLVR